MDHLSNENAKRFLNEDWMFNQFDPSRHFLGRHVWTDFLDRNKRLPKGFEDQPDRFLGLVAKRTMNLGDSYSLVAYSLVMPDHGVKYGMCNICVFFNSKPVSVHTCLSVDRLEDSEFLRNLCKGSPAYTDVHQDLLDTTWNKIVSLRRKMLETIVFTEGDPIRQMDTSTPECLAIVTEAGRLYLFGVELNMIVQKIDYGKADHLVPAPDKKAVQACFYEFDENNTFDYEQLCKTLCAKDGDVALGGAACDDPVAPGHVYGDEDIRNIWFVRRGDDKYSLNSSYLRGLCVLHADGTVSNLIISKKTSQIVCRSLPQQKMNLRAMCIYHDGKKLDVKGQDILGLDNSQVYGIAETNPQVRVATKRSADMLHTNVFEITHISRNSSRFSSRFYGCSNGGVFDANGNLVTALEDGVLALTEFWSVSPTSIILFYDGIQHFRTDQELLCATMCGGNVAAVTVGGQVVMYDISKQQRRVRNFMIRCRVLGISTGNLPVCIGSYISTGGTCKLVLGMEDGSLRFMNVPSYCGDHNHSEPVLFK